MTHEANRELDRVFGGEYGESPIRYQTRCTHGGKPCPKVIQALPMTSVHEATSRASCLPSLVVGALILGLAFLNQAVPAAAGALLAVLP